MKRLLRLPFLFALIWFSVSIDGARADSDIQVLNSKQHCSSRLDYERIVATYLDKTPANKVSDQETIKAQIALSKILIFGNFEELDAIAKRDNNYFEITKCWGKNSEGIYIFPLPLESYLFNLKNPNRGKEYLNAVISSGNSEGNIIFAEMYREGIAVPKSYELSIKYAEKSATRGNIKAQSFLADLYLELSRLNNSEIEKKKYLMLAYGWYNISGSESYFDRNNRDGVAQLLSNDEILSAQEKSIECHETKFEVCKLIVNN